MVYMGIHCHNCGISWKVGIADDYHRDGARTCPRCGKQIDRQTWEGQVLPALGAVHDANFELARDATGYQGQGAFSINVFSGDNPRKK